MNIYIVTDSSTYEPRAELISRYFADKGDNVTLIGTCFDHRKKQRRSDISETDSINDTGIRHIYLDAGGYKKNISPARLWYHYRFADKAYRLLKVLIKDEQILTDSGFKGSALTGIGQAGSGSAESDVIEKKGGVIKSESESLIYLLLPGNSLAKVGARLKKELNCSLIFDIIDLWPESLPVGGVKKTYPIRYWKNLRDDHLNAADHIVTECALYGDLLWLNKENVSVMYWPKTEEVRLSDGGEICKEDDCVEADKAQSAEDNRFKDSNGNNASDDGSKESKSYISTETIRIAYLGSINNIIDIPLIIEILSKVNKQKHVILEVIGNGEQAEAFTEALKNTGIRYHWHGAVFDEDKKQSILQGCEWGINIMKPGVKVGLTMKSVEYMANGLKLINNIPGDTWDMVEGEQIGVNVGTKPIEVSAYKVLKDDVHSKIKADDAHASKNERSEQPIASRKDAAEAAKLILRFTGADRVQIHKLYEERFSVRAMYEVLDEIRRLVIR